MPVNETLELERRLPDAMGSALDAIVVNGMWPGALQRRRAASCGADVNGGGPAAARAALPR